MSVSVSPLPFVGKRTHGLGQQLKALHLDTQLALARRHHRAVHADPVAKIEVGERREPFVADDGLRHEQLNFVVAVAHGGEDQLAGIAHQHDATGDGHFDVGFGAGLERAVCRA